jgi:thiopurine S-methyltransferase
MLIELTAEFWEERYKAGQTGWDIGYASTPLVSIIDSIKDKTTRILIPGAGNSYEAEYALNQGFTNVVVLDYAASALKNMKERVPEFPESQLIKQDFFEHSGEYDIILEQTFFCALNPNLREDYAKHMYQLLSKGGSVRGVMFDAPMNSDKPPFGGKSEDYRMLFSKYFDAVSIEPCVNSIEPRQGKEAIIKLSKF